MKIRNIALVLVIIAVSLFFSSCAANDAAIAGTLTGIWVDDTNNLAIQFFDNGRCRYGGDDVYADSTTQLGWTVTSSHIEVTDMLNFYSSSYAYTLSADGNTLSLYLIAVGAFNMTYDSLYPGDDFVLTRDTSTTDFDQILNNFW